MHLKRAYDFNLSITHIADRVAFFQGNNIMEGAFVKKENEIPESSYTTFGTISERQSLEIVDFIEDLGSQL